MNHLFVKFASCCLLIFSCAFNAYGEENFLLVNGLTNESICALGPYLNERTSPCSTFKITLSLMGYDAGILKNAEIPTWNFEEGYDDFLESWKSPQTPKSWMQYSCLWYSKVLALQLGLVRIKNYLSLMDYGNQDISGGLVKPGPADPAWVHSSLKISPKEQVVFIQKMIQGQLPISMHAVQMTKMLLFKEELTNGWQLFGKTGWSGPISREDDKTLEYAWFVGWIEKENCFFPFAYLIRERKIDLSQRIPRVKELLVQSHVMN